MDHRFTSRRRFLVTSVAGFGAALLAACSQAPTPAAPANPAKPADPAGAAKPADPAGAAKPADPAKPAAPAAAVPGDLKNVARNRTLIPAGLGGEHPGGFTDVDNFNQYLPNASRSGYTQAGTEGLFYYAPLTDDFQPWLAEGYTYGNDFTDVTVKLRKGVEWSDGKPFTARDVIFTMEMLAGEPTLLNGSEVKRLVKSMDMVDEQTVKFNLNFRNPRFVFDLLTFRADIAVPIAPEHVWKGQDPKSFKNYDPSKGWPLVTGPYKLVATTVEQKIWDVRDDWWGAKTGFKQLPKVERLIFLPGMNENTMAQKMIANEIDMAFSFTPGNMRAVQGQNKKVVTHSDQPPYGYMDWWPVGLGFNTTVKPFDDPEIRWAISYAINRDQLIKFAFQNFNQVAELPFPDFAGLRPYREAAKPLLEKYPTTAFDVTKTEEIMTRKGYKKDSEGMWVGADGQRVAIPIITFPQHPSCTPCAPIITEQLRQAGFDASFQLPADYSARIRTGEAKAYIMGHGGSMREPFSTWDRLYHMRHVKPTGTDNNNQNHYRWGNKAFSDIVDQMGQLAEDDPKLMDLWVKSLEIWLPELPDVQLVHTVIPVPMNTTYWTHYPSDKDPYVHEGFWHRNALQMFLGLEPAQ